MNTNPTILSDAAQATNHTVNLGAQVKKKSRHHLSVLSSQKQLLAAHKGLQALTSSPNPDPSAILSAKNNLSEIKAKHRHIIRQEQMLDEIHRDQKINNILLKNPGPSIYKNIRKFKSEENGNINNLQVKGKVYSGDQIPDGFFDSLSSLKAPDMTPIHTTPQFRNTLLDYENIIKICRKREKIPEISVKKSTEILLSLRAEVNDYYSITANHFIHAGRPGYEHFHFLLSSLARNMNLSTLEELNTVWACILYKGHRKDKESDRSYRTISTCPLLAKALDTYIGMQYGSGWQEVQASTQFQGPGSSHDLASLLLTETIQYSLHQAKQQAFVLLLDAKSAFDKVVHECAVRNAYLAGTQDQGLLYLDSRLRSRKTYVEWNKVLMGPINDTIGVEQGGVNSDRIYKMCNNVQLSTAQASGLGVDMGDQIISCIGQADDIALVSNNLTKLAGLLQLSIEYCNDYHVELVAEKTKLLVFSPSGLEDETHLQKLLCPLFLNGHQINFSTSAEHVGVLRSTEGNMAHVMSRLSAHTRAILSIAPSGMAYSHNGNPAASLRLERLYGSPVLLSGLASLVLSNAETAAVHHHHKVNLERLLKLHRSTPECVVMFLAGSLPATALIHLRMLSILGMVARLGPGNVLHHHGRTVLLSRSASRSWFVAVRSVCLQYALPDPLLVLQTPPTKETWKRLTKSKVIDYWEVKLRAQSAILPSLEYFHPEYMSLRAPHPMFLAAHSPFEVRKAIVVARMLSGRYRTDRLARHWSQTNPSGSCQLPGCTGTELGDLPHILLYCPALKGTRSNLVSLWANFIAQRRYLYTLIRSLTSQEKSFMQLLLDPSSIPSVILANKDNSDVLSCCFYLSRTWVHSLHLQRRKLQKLWNLF